MRTVVFPPNSTASSATTTRLPSSSSPSPYPTMMHLLLLLLCSLAKAELSARLGDCAPKSCGGTSPNISFPFYVKSSSKSYCGHRLFAVSCNNGLPVMTFSGVNYSITNITYDKKAFILRKASQLEAGGGGRRCPLPSRNFSLVDDFFEPSGGWLYFHSNCTHLEGKSSGTGGHDNNINVTCGGADGENGTREYYYVGRKEERKDMSCSSVVKYPATNGWRSGVVGSWDVLNQSFGLNWQGLECRRCTASGGECAYDDNKTATVCICGHGVRSRDCEKEGGAKKARLIILMVSSITGSFLLGSLLFLHLVHTMRKNASFLGTCLQGIQSNDNSTRERSLLGNHFQTHMFSYRELEEATDGFATSREIGDGGFGIVYKGKLRDGRVVAVKRLYERNRRRMEQFVNEVSIFSRVCHKNLVSLYGCTNYNNRELLLVYEYISNGTVADHLYGDGSRAERRLTWPLRMSIAMETAEVLAYLHTIEPPIIHRDIKTSNILLDDHYHVKVADLGLSRLFPPDASYVSTAPQGTPGYLDPEYQRCYQLTDKSDVYSFGVVLAELVSSKPAVDISRDASEINLADMAINKIQGGLIHELFDRGLLGFETDSEVRTMMEEVAMLIFRCLQAEKVLRPSMQEITEMLKGIGSQLKATDATDSQMLARKCQKKSVCSEV